MHVPRRTMAVVITLMISAILLVLLAVYQGDLALHSNTKSWLAQKFSQEH